MSFTSTLLQWFLENGRDLPWRQTRDPYAVWNHCRMVLVNDIASLVNSVE